MVSRVAYARTARLRQEVGHDDASGRSGKRADNGVRPERLDRAIAPPTARGIEQRGLSMDLECPVEKVDDPVLGDAGSRKGAALASPIEPQAGQGNLDHQRGAGGMRVAVVARRAADHADVRLRLRPGT